MPRMIPASSLRAGVGVLTIGLTLAGGVPAQPPDQKTPFDVLMIYNGDWAVRALVPWSGAAPGSIDRLKSQCQRFTLYFACEQTVNDKPQALIVYTIGAGPGTFNTRTISPNGLAGGRGDLTIDGNHWTYLDKPPSGLAGPWSRVENMIVDRNHIRFEEYESIDEGKNWTLTNSGTEERAATAQPR